MDREAARIAKLIRRVGSDVDAPAELLAVAAEYLAAGKPMPDTLADYLARAFRRAAAIIEAVDGKRPEELRIATLAHALGMTRNEGRPPANVSKFDVALTVAVHGHDVSESELAKALASAYGVSETTARKRIKEAKAKIAEGRSLFGQLPD
jgi:CubicO group peptidase (beta-lactamase class C family)